MPRSAATTLKAFERFGRPRDRDGARAVDRRDRQALDRVGNVLDRLGRGEHRGHAARVVRQLLVGAAVIDDLDRGAQVENAGGFRRGDFADAVAKHRRRAQAAARAAPRLPQPGCRRSSGCATLVSGSRSCQRVAEHRVLERPAGDLLEVAVDLIEARAEAARCCDRPAGPCRPTGCRCRNRRKRPAFRRRPRCRRSGSDRRRPR